MLLAWMENDDYGCCSGLEKEAVRILDRAGLQAFERVVREKAGPTEKDSYARRRKVEILKAIHEARRDAAAYAALCEAEGDLEPADCETLAGMCLKRRRPEDALSWVERGLELERQGRREGRPAWHLSGLRREILLKLGRRGDALASAWGDYRRAPSVPRYEDVMKYVPKGERPAWHAKALEALETAGLSSRIDLLVRTKERARLAALVDAAPRASLMTLSHYTTEPAADSLEKSHPLLAAKLHVAMALRIVEAKKSRYYGAALGNLEKARKIMLKHGRDEEWEALAGEIRERHRRKTGFMSGFERLVDGRPMEGPSFVERARKRWDRGAGRERGTS
jgi:hypothetical protein